jgi:DNA-binding transcriptional ArsR family regulator
MSTSSEHGPARKFAWDLQAAESGGDSMHGIQVVSMSRALKALCDSNRIRILELLVTGEYCVSDLVERLQMDQPKVSHHLAILRSSAIIRSRRDGRRINYSLRPTVHRVVETPEGTADIFDLGHLSVAFRFRQEPPPQGPAATSGSGAPGGPVSPLPHAPATPAPGGPATAGGLGAAAAGGS